MVVASAAGKEVDGEIHVAAQNGDESAVKKLVEEDPKVVCAKGENGQTGLHFAAVKGHEGIIKVTEKKKKIFD